MQRPHPSRALRTMLAAALCLLGVAAIAQNKSELVKTPSGWQLRVDGKPFYVKGLTWSHTPVGYKYDYSLFDKDDAHIKAVLKRDMTMLRDAGCNAIRGLPPRRWAKYIHETYGISFILNDYYERYGMMVDDVWVAQTNYQDPKVRKLLVERWKKIAADSKDAPGLVAYLIGNENNYGLEWASAEVENLPAGERHAARAKYLYSLFNEIALAVKAIDPNHPIGIVNGDLQYLDIIARECPAIDFLGTNVYRGHNYRDLFDTVAKKLGKPVLVTETGCDAFDVQKNAENQQAQAEYVFGNWIDLYRNTAGNGGAGNSIGAMTFEYADEWWKHGQTVNLRVHDTTASWKNKDVAYDYGDGSANNMNEEWFGVCSIREEEIDGVHIVTPRMAYFALKDAWKHNPYSMGSAAVKAMKPDNPSYRRDAEKSAQATAVLLKSAKLPPPPVTPKATLPLAVYRDNKGLSPWIPSGYMGDADAISMQTNCRETPRSGDTCVKIVFNKANGWGGVFWQDPANDWGDGPGGYNLSGAKTLSFYARGKNGGESVKFGFGGIGKNKPFYDTANSQIALTLGKEWKKFTIPLNGKDLSRIKTGFVWVLSAPGKPVEFYLDDIIYE